MDISVFSSMLSVTAKTERRREGKKLRQYLAALAGNILITLLLELMNETNVREVALAWLSKELDERMRKYM